jgi:exopolysaccharide production protein ExoQ
MTEGQERSRSAIEAALEPFGSPRFSAALSTLIVGTLFLTFLIGNTIGQPGLIAIVIALLVFAALSVLGQQSSLEWRGFLPFSLLAFVAWTAISIFFSQYHWLTLGGIISQIAVALLGVYVALARDFIQIVRTMGDVLRLVIGLSLALEVVVGILFDTSFPLLGITGSLAHGGPIQGVMGTRDDLGLVAVLALVTFVTELLTRSVGRTTAILSIIGTTLTIGFVKSPVNFGVVLVLGIAALILLFLRRVPAHTQRYWLIGVGVTAVAGVIAAYALRDRILALLGATGALKYRVSLWRDLFPFIQAHQIEGWGWVGLWPNSDIVPFVKIGEPIQHYSALSAYFDAWFQLGIVGLFTFLVLVGLAVVKSWVLATQKRSRIFVWPALIMVALLTTALTQSGILINWGWLVVVICSVKAAQHLRWRQPLPD